MNRCCEICDELEMESVERRSSRAVADSGMALMEVPPEMWPTLMVVRGLAGSLREAIWVIRVAEDEDRVGGAGVISMSGRRGRGDE